MTRSHRSLLGGAATLALAQSAAYVGIGRVATPAELAAWDIDVRPDFKGLPKGSGTVAQGQQIWEDQCASCHGMFGESNQVFQPIVGGTGANDVQRGRSAAPHRSVVPRAHHADEAADAVDAVGLRLPRDAVERAEVAVA